MTTAILACDVFQEELEALLPELLPEAPVRYLEMGLHDTPDRLRESVSGVIAELESDPGLERILLAYGRCGNGLVGVRAARSPLILPQAHDCLSVLLGGRERHNALLRENPGTYFYSPGWVRGKRVPGPDREAHLRELYAERFADDPEMIDDLVEADADAFAHHNCAAYVDITGNREAEAYCRQCAAHMGWSYRRLQGDPSFLRDLLGGHWDDPQRFLLVPPGHLIAADDTGHLFAESPS